MLASGGNDNLLRIWPNQHGECFANEEPTFSFQ